MKRKEKKDLENIGMWSRYAYTGTWTSCVFHVNWASNIFDRAKVKFIGVESSPEFHVMFYMKQMLSELYLKITPSSIHLNCTWTRFVCGYSTWAQIYLEPKFKDLHMYTEPIAFVRTINYHLKNNVIIIEYLGRLWNFNNKPKEIMKVDASPLSLCKALNKQYLPTYLPTYLPSPYCTRRNKD